MSDRPARYGTIVLDGVPTIVRISGQPVVFTSPGHRRRRGSLLALNPARGRLSVWRGTLTCSVRPVRVRAVVQAPTAGDVEVGALLLPNNQGPPTLSFRRDPP